MKVLHCCLAAFYIDNFGYQENILPKMHAQQGNEVKIIASTETYLKGNKLGYIPPSSYINENGIPVVRLPYIKWLPHKLVRKLRIYSGLKKELEAFSPDVIFLHDIQFISIKRIRKYVADHPTVKVYADGHTDFINSAKSWVSEKILHRLIYRWCARIIEPVTTKFYGTLPIRMDFFTDVYKIPSRKVELLELGADDTLFDLQKKSIIRKEIRQKLGLKETDFVLISGGKIDKRKNIHVLIDQLKMIKDDSIKLIVFGSPDEEMNYLVSEIEDISNVLYVGWQDTSNIYNLLLASDLGVFPGTHSVLWEQSCGVGLPCIFKKWDKIQHLDKGGNCIFIDENELADLPSIISNLSTNRAEYSTMEKAAIEKCVNHFSYSEIAKRAIEQF